MINYIVEDIEELLSLLKNEGIDQIEELQQFAFGKFAQILDPEENKIEFWEPDKQFFEQRYKELGCTV